VNPWLARLRHDLVKQLVWRARDVRDLAPPDGAKLLRDGLFALVDGEGRPTSPRELWQALRAEAPAPAAALDRFEAVLDAAQAAVQAGEVARAVEALLALEPAFQQLAQEMKKA
jgi:hypothetical protein